MSMIGHYWPWITVFILGMLAGALLSTRAERCRD